MPVCKPYCYHEWGLSTLKRKNRPLCETPRSGYFCGPDKYLRLQEHTISEELFPVMEVDSYFVLVRSGSGSFIINGEEFPVQAGCLDPVLAGADDLPRIRGDAHALGRRV